MWPAQIAHPMGACRQRAAFGPKINSTTGYVDFEGGCDRTRYDTPKFGPVMLSASFGKRSSSPGVPILGWAAHLMIGVVDYWIDRKNGNVPGQSLPRTAR